MLAIERTLPALWPALGVAALFVAAALCGVFALLPWTLHALILAAAITAIGLSLYRGFDGFTFPAWDEGARRLERDSGLHHRPISEQDDRLASGRGDAWTETIWRIHRIRATPLGALRLSWPRPDWRARDPHGLRFYALLLVACGLVVARGGSLERLTGAFGSGAQPSLDAWIDPPAYTGLPPVYLKPGAIAVPENSTLHVRVHGAARMPGLALGLGTAHAGFSGSDGEYAASARIQTSGVARVRAGGRSIGAWTLHIIADKPPTIAFAGIPAKTDHDAVKFSYTTSDDYGVVSARAILTPHGRANSHPLIVDLDLTQGAKTQISYADLTAHPYAGLEVDARLEARDAAGHVGVSDAVRFTLPARVFTDPLARALIEQRGKLAVGGLEGRGAVAAMLDALTFAPEQFYDGKPGLYLTLRSAYWDTKLAHDDADLERVETLLWQIAAGLEQGGLLDAAAELRRLQQLLTQALASGAPQAVIDALLDRYDEALKKYMQALANNPQASAGPPPPDAKMVGQQDIEALLKAIQQMSQSGNREQAAQMLALLQSMLENMRMAQGGQGGGQGGGSPADKAMRDTIGKLGDLMGQERALLDKTFRQQQGNGDPRDGGPQGLARQQQQIQNDLQQLQKNLGPKAPLAPAGKAMGDAGRDLGARDLANAGSDEKDALEALRRGADALAKQMQGQDGRSGDAKEDPLGRGAGVGNGVKIPDLSDLARARAILEELRKRAGERGRPQQELDYIDRLLKLF